MPDRLTAMRKISKVQAAALTFALTEGEVGPGCQVVVSSSRGREIAIARASTIGALVKAGLLARTFGGFGMLTAAGEVAARRAFAESRGHEWAHPAKVVAAEVAARKPAPLPLRAPFHVTRPSPWSIEITPRGRLVMATIALAHVAARADAHRLVADLMLAFAAEGVSPAVYVVDGVSARVEMGADDSVGVVEWVIQGVIGGAR